MKGLENYNAVKSKTNTLNFKYMKTIENTGIDYMMIVIITLYTVMHFMAMM